MAFRRLLQIQAFSGNPYIKFSNYQCFGKFQTKLNYFTLNVRVHYQKIKMSLCHDSGLTEAVPSRSLWVRALETSRPVTVFGRQNVAQG